MRAFIATFIFLLCVDVDAKPSEAYVLYNVNEHKIVTSKNQNDIASIASLTKLMTAMVALDYDKNTDRRILERLLIRSDNAAAIQLAKTYPGGYDSFIMAMNNKAAKLNLINTKYKDPHGLNVDNSSTASEYVRVVMEADTYPVIRDISSTAEKKIPVTKQKGKKKKIYYITLRNTNSSLLQEFNNIALSKTGFTNHAGRCLALVVENTKKYVIVILGEPTPLKRAEIARELMSMAK